MTTEAERILEQRQVTIKLDNSIVYDLTKRYKISNIEELESITESLLKVYDKKPFASVGIDLYWCEDKE